MPKIKVTLSIGFANADQEGIIEVDDDDYQACDSDKEKELLFDEYWQDWANNYIEGSATLVE